MMCLGYRKNIKEDMYLLRRREPKRTQQNIEKSLSL